MKKDMIILTHTPIDYDSRIIKQVKFFSEEYHVVLYAQLLDEKSLEMFEGYDVEFIRIPVIPVSKFSIRLLKDFLKNIYEDSFKRKVKRIIKKRLRAQYRFTDLYYTHSQINPWFRKNLKDKYNKDYSNIAVLWVNDLTLIHGAGLAKLEFDREGYVIPLVCDLHEAFFDYKSGADFQHYLNLELMKRNLKKVDILTAPTEKILEGYLKMPIELKETLKYKPVYNTSPYEELTPNPKGEKTKLVHVGAAIRARKLEKMIEAMKYLDENYELHFHLITTNSPVRLQYMEELADFSKELGVADRVFFNNPIAPEELVGYLNRYDIGIYYLESNQEHRNVDYASPNKIFQYIQARLALVVTDIGEMGDVVKEYNVGTVSNFTVADFAQKIIDANNSLEEYKANSDKAAFELSADKQLEDISNLIEEYHKEMAN